jgi:hypothetical protein
MPITPADEAALTVLLAEYKEAKAEQRDRIRWRDSLVYAAPVALFLAFGAVASGKAPATLLLATPLIGYMLGHGFIDNDVKISAIRRDIRNRIAPSVRGMLADAPTARGLFGWEDEVSPRRVHRTLLRLAANLVAFMALPFAGPVWYATQHGLAGGQAAIVAVELVGLLLLASEFVRYSGLRVARYR